MNPHDISSLQERLDELRRRSAALLDSGKWAACTAAHQRLERSNQEILQLERELAIAEGRQYADPYQWDVPWTVSSDFESCYRGIHQSWIAYNCFRSESPENTQIAIIRLIHAYSLRAGGSNDEVIEGHPLFGSGIHNCGAFIICNSNWIDSERRIQSVHDQFSQSQWDVLRHFMWTFHDGIVEAIAEGVSVATQVGVLSQRSAGSPGCL